MCGILGLWCQKSVPDINIIDKLFTYAEKRGKDGVGYFIYNSRSKVTSFRKFKESYSEVRVELLSLISKELTINSVLLGICRSQPETEGNTTIVNMQPIVHDPKGLYLVHNGAISNRIYNELKKWNKEENDSNYYYTTNIDSEAILVSYLKHNRNIKDALEYLSGGMACLMVDSEKNCLFLWNDHQPLSHSYIRGDLGCYFLHSSDECLRDIVKYTCHATADGVCCWEQWYGHPLNGPRIKILDLESGFVSTIKYSPRYITSTWDSYLSKQK